MSAPVLDKFLANKSGNFYYICTYRNAWDAEKKRSMRLPGSKTVGKIVSGAKTGLIEWYDAYVQEHPELLQYTAMWLGKGKIEWTLKPEDDDLPLISVRAAANLTRVHAGATWVLDNLIKDTPLAVALSSCFAKYHNHKKLLSLAYFMILAQGNVMDRYRAFAKTQRLPWRCPLSGSAITRLFQNITPAAIDRFFNLYNELLATTNHGQKTKYWAFDSTSISTSSRNLTTAAWGKNKDGDALKQYNILFIVNQETGEPLYYRHYRGNIPDVYTVKHLLQEKCRLGLDPDAVFVADRGYGAIPNINRFMQTDTKFLFNVSTRLSMCKELFNEVKAKLKHPCTSIAYYEPSIGNSCTTIETQWSYPVNYKTDCKKRRPHVKGTVYVHIYFNSELHHNAQVNLRNLITAVLHKWQRHETLDSKEQALFNRFLIQDKDEPQRYVPNPEAFNHYLQMEGVRILISNEVKDAVTAWQAYYDRNEVEQAFRIYKDRLGCYRSRCADDRSLEGKGFVQFLATAISIMFRKRVAAAVADKRLALSYNSDRKLLALLNTIDATVFELGVYYNEITKPMRTVFEALNIPLPTEEVGDYDEYAQQEELEKDEAETEDRPELEMTDLLDEL